MRLDVTIRPRVTTVGIVVCQCFLRRLLGCDALFGLHLGGHVLGNEICYPWTRQTRKTGRCELIEVVKIFETIFAEKFFVVERYQVQSWSLVTQVGCGLTGRKLGEVGNKLAFRVEVGECIKSWQTTQSRCAERFKGLVELRLWFD